MKYLAHNSNYAEQTIRRHCSNVARISQNNSIDLFKDYAYFCGKIHDIGKFSKEFQQRIRGSEIKVEHANCGAKEILKMYNCKFFCQYYH